MNQTLNEQYVAIMSTNLMYQRNRDHWDYLLNSYMGGVEYQRGQYLTRYVNETEKDIDFIKQWLHDHVEYKDILIIQWGGTLGIFPNTYLDENKEQLGVRMIGPQPSLWINEAINSTPASRATWVKELNALSKSLGYTVADNLDNHFLLETLINV